jgi:hypothetical protein
LLFSTNFTLLFFDAAKLSIPIHASLNRLLALADRNRATIIATAYGKPFSIKGFGNMGSTAIRDAGLLRVSTTEVDREDPF